MSCRVADDMELVERRLNAVRESLCQAINYMRSPSAHAYADGAQWLEDFIMQPHAGLGRDGPVCPFARISRERHALHFATLDASDVGFRTFALIGLHLPDVYLDILRQSKCDEDLFALAIFMEGLVPSNYAKYVDVGHSMLKPAFMDVGLMLGEFHPASSVHGARSASFRPMRSPGPMLVIRKMSSHDILFIDKANASNESRAHELECYLKHVGGKLEETQRDKVLARLDALNTDI